MIARSTDGLDQMNVVRHDECENDDLERRNWGLSDVCRLGGEMSISYEKFG
jgi:hypothetical protein